MAGFADNGVVGAWTQVAFGASIDIPRWASKAQVFIPAINASIVTPQVSIAEDEWAATFSAIVSRGTAYPTAGAFVGSVFDEFTVPSGGPTDFRLSSGAAQTAEYTLRFI